MSSDSVSNYSSEILEQSSEESRENEQSDVKESSSSDQSSNQSSSSEGSSEDSSEKSSHQSSSDSSEDSSDQSSDQSTDDDSSEQSSGDQSSGSSSEEDTSDEGEESEESDDDDDYISKVPAADRRSFERFDKLDKEERKKQSWREKRREKKLKKLKSKVPETPYHTMSVKEVSKTLTTDTKKGLSKEEAKARLERDGTNELHGSSGPHPLRLLVGHLINGMNIILFIAMVISFATQQWVEAIVIVIIIVSNTIIGFFQEYKSEQALAALQKMSAPVARVMRDGVEMEIPTAEVVKGDVVLIDSGDIVCADLRIFTASNLAIDEALLTGESEPVDKIIEPLERLDEGIGDRINLAYMSTTVTKGRGKGIVIKTGMETEIGAIANKLSETSRSKTSPLMRKLDILSYILFGIAIVLGILVLGVNKWETDDKVFLLYAISIGICIIPEGLPAVMSVTMTAGVRTMTKQKAIVRKITALEVLGAVTNICSDKTGTLTQAKMVATRMWTPDDSFFSITGEGFSLEGDILNEKEEKVDKFSSTLTNLLYCTSLCNMAVLHDEEGEEGKDASVDIDSDEDHDEIQPIGDPTEISLQVLAHKVNLGKPDLLEKGYKVVCEHQFDSGIKRMSVVVKHKGKLTGYLKGAPERVLDCCTHYQDGDEIKTTTDDFHDRFQRVNGELASDGLRVLAIAYRPDMKEEHFTPRETTESEFIFVGFVGIYDPPRPESKRAVEICHRAGIVVHMATGDHPATARSIAKQVGILPDDYDESMVMTAREFDSMTDDEIDQLEHIPLVLARCSPDSKVKMIGALHRRNKLVAMTGDGVNDAPALNASDIGIAMGKTGSDVAKQAADMILTDDNFATIVSATSTGRRILNNISKLLSVLLVGNFSLVVMLILGLPIFDTNDRTVFALSPLQALWFNLITSSPPAIGLGYEKQSKYEMRKPPKSTTKRLRDPELAYDIMVFGILLGCLGLGVHLFTLYMVEDGTLGQRCNKSTSESVDCDAVFRSRSVGFMTISISMYLHSFNCKQNRKPIWRTNLIENKILLFSTLISLAVTVPLPYIPFINDKVFVMAPIQGWHWLVVLVGIITFLVCGETYKFFKRLCLPTDVTDTSIPLDELELKAINS